MVTAPPRRAWPYPGDSPVVRARRVALAYRAKLAEVAPAAAAELDTKMHQWAQDWITPQLQRFRPDDWVGSRDAAEIAHIEPSSVRDLRRRGRLPGRRNKTTGTWEFKVADVQALSTGIRHRTRGNRSQ